MPTAPPLPFRNRFARGLPSGIQVTAPPRPTPTAAAVPARNTQGFTPEEQAAVEARGQEIYAEIRSGEIEEAAQARARQLYRAMIGKDAPSTSGEVAVAPAVEG